jgi:8-oxo-dGTP pyrophosphatase MutT (NUDIX family)
VKLPRPWTTRGSRVVLEDRWIRLAADDCVTAEGREVSPYYVLHQADFVHVAAVTDDRRMVMVRQYRQGSRLTHLELPAGMIDAEDADPLSAARRELREETGFDAAGWKELAVWFANPARQSNRQFLLLAEGAVRMGEAAPDGVESLVVELVPLADLPGLIASGAIDSTLHVAAVSRALMALGGPLESGSV